MIHHNLEQKRTISDNFKYFLKYFRDELRKEIELSVVKISKQVMDLRHARIIKTMLTIAVQMIIETWCSTISATCADFSVFLPVTEGFLGIVFPLFLADDRTVVVTYPIDSMDFLTA
ncbi:hypothetical protein T03_8838 [Trichinella britovi]|uniref:Uncharacterized protein n=1 Tax=Trichinella britovi TaxID=45882 RepID=A0A0V1C606_TRIBR|nr:hypothetical protein T03_15417 [Trichinella britovi]KRY44412.1 hypothetical protein T03_8838 [Trichinella britovi]